VIPHRGAQVLTVVVFCSVCLLGLYIGLGGASYAPMEVADPCEERPLEAPEGIEATVKQLALSALDGAACELQVTREDLVLSLADPEERAAFLDEREISDETLEAAVRGGLQRAYDDAVEVGAISGLEAVFIGEAIQRVPVDVLVDIAQSETAQEAAALLGDFATSDGASQALDTLQDLLD
jgi:hypothetical protein